MLHFFVFIGVVVLLVLTFSKVRASFGWLFFFALLLRLTVLYLDIYHITSIPFTGEDTENFHNYTLMRLSGMDVILTRYTVFLTWVYSFFGDDGRFMAQLINVLLSYGTLLVLYRAMVMLNVSTKLQKRALLVLAFMPVLLCFSGVLLREAICEFFVALSMYYMVLWYVKGGMKYLVAAFGSVLVSMMMHAGCIGVLVGYLFAVLKGRGVPRRTSSYEILGSVFVLAAVSVVVLSNNTLFLGKFTDSMEGETSYLDQDLAFNVGGSSYLLWLEGRSTVVGLLFAPLRMFYLLFSPVPWDWRGLMDVVVFMVDSIVYILLMISILQPIPTHHPRHFGRIRRTGRQIPYPSPRPIVPHQSRMEGGVMSGDLLRYEKLRRCLVYSIVFTVFIFALGTSNSGTAIRHRSKIIPIVVLAYSVSVDLRKSVRRRSP